MNAFRITTLPRSFAAYDGRVPSARQFYVGAVDGKYPAHQVNGIWHYDPADLPAIAATYGLTPKAAAEPARRRKVTSSPATVAA